MGNVIPMYLNLGIIGFALGALFTAFAVSGLRDSRIQVGDCLACLVDASVFWLLGVLFVLRGLAISSGWLWDLLLLSAVAIAIACRLRRRSGRGLLRFHWRE